MKLTDEQKELIKSKRVKSNLYEKERQRFLMLPTGLVFGELYRDLTIESKFTWTILNDRAKLSKRNGWFDEDGSIYFIFNNNDLVRLLRIGEKKVIKIKNELNYYGLLEQKRLGRGMANRLYIYEPVLTEKDLNFLLKEDIFAEEDSSDVQNSQNDSSEESAKNCQNDSSEENAKNCQNDSSKESIENTENSQNDSSRTVKNPVLELPKRQPSNTKFSNTNYININESAKAESNAELSTNQYFKKSKLLTDFRVKGIPESVTNELYRATGDTEKIGYICGVIYQAKRYVTNQKNYEIYLEELTEDDFEELTKCILRVLKKTLTENTVESYDRYLFKTIQNFFEKYVNREKVPIVKWTSM